jgi:hypothetical protein
LGADLSRIKYYRNIIGNSQIVFWQVLSWK